MFTKISKKVSYLYEKNEYEEAVWHWKYLFEKHRGHRETA
ncbi:hypothetical protein K4569_01225 [Bacillus bingmayongensis]|nr:hypothetical protein [Bacillus bingmayongensis]